MRKQNTQRPIDADPDFVDFLTVAEMLGITHAELASLVGKRGFPRKVADMRRGFWRREEIRSYIARTHQFQSQPTTRPNPTGPRAA